MLKWNREKFKGFLLGACTIGILASVGTVYADGKLTTINVVQGGIKLFVEGKLVIPTDSDGKVVEPFIYDGTTYLPLRALSNALTNYQKPVKWDGDTSSIYIGQAPVAAQTDITELKPYEITGEILTGSEAIINILDKKITPFNLFHCNYTTWSTEYGNGIYNYGQSYRTGVGNSGAYYTYVLNSKYSSINGQFVIPYDKLGARGTSKIQFYSVNNKGGESLIKEYSTDIGNNILDVNVDLRGVNILRIRFDRNSSGDGTFYNVTLAGI